MIEILLIDTKEQLADILTKPLDEKLFVSLREKLLGWWLCKQSVPHEEVFTYP